MGQRAKKFATLLFAFGFALTLYGFIRGSYATRAPGPIVCAVAIFILCCDCNGRRITCDFTTTTNNNSNNNNNNNDDEIINNMAVPVAFPVAVIERRRSCGSAIVSANFTNVSSLRRTSLLPSYDSLPPNYYTGHSSASINRNILEGASIPPPSYEEAVASPSCSTPATSISPPYSVTPHESPPSYDNT